MATHRNAVTAAASRVEIFLHYRQPVGHDANVIATCVGPNGPLTLQVSDLTLVTAAAGRHATLRREIDDLRARLADLEAENRQQGQIMREQGSELRDAEREALNAWYASEDGAR